MIGFSEILFLVCVGIILINIRKLPDAARGIKQAVRNFNVETSGGEKRTIKNVTPTEET